MRFLSRLNLRADSSFGEIWFRVVPSVPGSVVLRFSFRVHICLVPSTTIPHPTKFQTMYHYFLFSMLLMATAAGRLSHPKAPSRATRPKIPKQYLVSVTLIVPMLTQLPVTISWHPQQSCFRTTANDLISSGLVYNGENRSDHEELFARLDLERNGFIYFPLPPTTIKEEQALMSWVISAKAWTTEHGFIDESTLDGCDLYRLYFPILLGAAFSPQHWTRLRPTEPKTIGGEELNGWIFPEKFEDDYEATVYATFDGIPKFIVFEGEPGNGVLATLPVRIDSVFEALEGDSPCSSQPEITATSR